MRVYTRTFLPFADRVLPLNLLTVSNKNVFVTGLAVSHVLFGTRNLLS